MFVFSTLIRDVITTQKAWSFKLATLKTSPPFLSWPTEEAISATPCMTRNVLTPKLVSPSLSNTQLLFFSWSTWPGCLHRTGFTILDLSVASGLSLVVQSGSPRAQSYGLMGTSSFVNETDILFPTWLLIFLSSYSGRMPKKRAEWQDLFLLLISKNIKNASKMILLNFFLLLKSHNQKPTPSSPIWRPELALLWSYQMFSSWM